MNSPLSFCMITTFFPPFNFGGDGVFVEHLTDALARLGHRVDVIHCMDSYRVLSGHLPKSTRIQHPNVTVHSLKSPFGFLSPLSTHQTGYPIFKSKRIRDILAKGFDVIHYHNISLVGGPEVVRFGEGIKLYTLHEYWLVCPMHVLFKFSRAECKQRSCLVCSLAHKRPPQFWRYFYSFERIKKHIDLFLTPSRFCMEKHREMGFDAPMAHLPNFVPFSEKIFICCPDVSDRENIPYFLFVGRLEKIKGIQTLIPTFRHYPKAELWIAGKGSYEGHLKHLAKDSVNIRFLGYQRGESLAELYRNAIAVIIPSLCYEISSLVIPEAFTHRTPVIARKLGGMPEIVEKSNAGILFETEDELLHALDYLAENPSHRRALGERGYKAYLEYWSPNIHLKKYFELIDKVKDKKSTNNHIPTGDFL